MSNRIEEPRQIDAIAKEHSEVFFEMLFGQHDWQDDEMVEIRLLGEKDTDNSEFRYSQPIQPGVDQSIEDFVDQHKAEWRQNNVGAFICPGVLNDRRATDASVQSFNVVCIDIDTGDTVKKLDWLREVFGTPTMVVESGGHTEDGLLKLHVYYKLTEMCEDVAAVAELREQMATLCGADFSFKRIPQVIRIPGTAHTKGGRDGTCKIISNEPGMEYDFDRLSSTATTVAPMPGAGRELQSSLPQTSVAGGMDFSQVRDKANINSILTADVAEGGEDRTRWSEFSSVAGHYIHTARLGEISLSDALAMTKGWVLAHMVPSWGDDRVEREFQALTDKDIMAKGEFSTARLPSQTALRQAEQAADKDDGEPWLHAFSAHRYFVGEAPSRRFMVEGLVLAARPQMLVGEAGAGKTYLGLDLALKIACGYGTWCGQRVTEHGGKYTVFLVAEDDKDEVHLRLEEIDPTGEMRAAAGDRLIILPLPDIGGAFPLVEADRAGNTSPSQKWMELWPGIEALSQTDFGLGAVIVDTFSATMHGEENAANCVNEWFRVANNVCALGSALIVTHHTRKQGRAEIRTPSDMLDAVRGSSALPANVRGAIGIWQDLDYEENLKALGQKVEPGVLYKMAVIKANNPEMMKGTRLLIRGDKGGLLIPAEDAKRKIGLYKNETEAWLIFAIEQAAMAKWPFTAHGGPTSRGLWANKAELLPDCLKGLSKNRFKYLTDRLLSEGRLVQVTTEDDHVNCLDVPLERGSAEGKHVKSEGWIIGDKTMFTMFLASEGGISLGETHFEFDKNQGIIVPKRNAVPWKMGYS